MKKADSVLIVTAFLLLMALLFHVGAWTFLKFVVALVIIGFVLYWKLFPYRHQLYPKYAKVMDTGEKVFSPILSLFSKLPNAKVGDKLFVDTKFLVFCSILLLILVIV